MPFQGRFHCNSWTLSLFSHFLCHSKLVTMFASKIWQTSRHVKWLVANYNTFYIYFFQFHIMVSTNDGRLLYSFIFIYSNTTFSSFLLFIIFFPVLTGGAVTLGNFQFQQFLRKSSLRLSDLPFEGTEHCSKANKVNFINVHISSK